MGGREGKGEGGKRCTGGVGKGRGRGRGGGAWGVAGDDRSLAELGMPCANGSMVVVTPQGKSRTLPTPTPCTIKPSWGHDMKVGNKLRTGGGGGGATTGGFATERSRLLTVQV